MLKFLRVHLKLHSLVYKNFMCKKAGCCNIRCKVLCSVKDQFDDVFLTKIYLMFVP